MRKFIIAFFLLVGLTACASMMPKMNRVSSSLQSLEYNDVASKYMTRPTFVSFYNDGLRVNVNNYGTKEDWFEFAKVHVDDYVRLIDKYIEWYDIASQKGDVLEKDIGEVNSVLGINLIFQYYSASVSRHLLVIQTRVLGSKTDSQLIFDRPNALVLRDLLLKYKAGELKQTNESDYQ
jgi:hypothetical protein